MAKLFFPVAVIVASCCFAQESSAVQIKVVKGAPFTAQAITESSQVLADGNHISRSVSVKIARDSEGRTRREQVLATGGSIVFLQDPVASYGYVIDMTKKSVRRYTTATAVDSASAQPIGTHLGSQVIEGLQAVGTKLTQTVNAGDAGNERSFDVTVEAWYSTDLQTVLLRKTSDPRTGDTIYKLTNIERIEPDPSLFQIPVGFVVHEEVKLQK